MAHDSGAAPIFTCDGMELCECCGRIGSTVKETHHYRKTNGGDQEFCPMWT